jgi:hypothetical protein
MTTAESSGSKALGLGDPRFDLIVDCIGLDLAAIPHLFSGSAPLKPTGQRGIWAEPAPVLSAGAFRTLVIQ